MKNQLACVICLISFSAVAQIGAKAQQNKIQGIWQNSQSGFQMVLMLNPDGSGEFDGEPVKYTIAGNKLSVTQSGVVTNYSFNLQGNSLTLSGGDLEGSVIFSRNGAAVSQPVAEGQEVQTIQKQQPSSSATTTNSKSLIGAWSGNGETIEFRSDGQCTYLGNSFSYQHTSEQITFITNQGNMVFGYSIQGDQLTLNANGKNIVYKKGSVPAANTGKGGVAMELVGEWCYMNMSTNSQSSRCIILNADGTYRYTSESSRSVNTDTFSGGTSSQGADQGTWYVQGDRIYYNSQTNGTGSYRLEKRNHPKNVSDPMIVLDGESFVTTTLRQPWR